MLRLFHNGINLRLVLQTNPQNRVCKHRVIASEAAGI